MLLYLIRHAEAMPDNAKQDLHHFREPGSLTNKGRDNAVKVGRLLQKKGISIDEAWYSVKLRAKQTADLLAKELKIKDVYKKEGLSPNDPVGLCREKIEREGVTSLAIISHLPFLPKLATLLIYGTEDNFEKITFNNCGMICLEETDNKWQMVWALGADIRD